MGFGRKSKRQNDKKKTINNPQTPTPVPIPVLRSTHPTQPTAPPASKPSARAKNTPGPAVPHPKPRCAPQNQPGPTSTVTLRFSIHTSGHGIRKISPWEYHIRSTAAGDSPNRATRLACAIQLALGSRLGLDLDFPDCVGASGSFGEPCRGILEAANKETVKHTVASGSGKRKRAQNEKGTDGGTNRHGARETAGVEKGQGHKLKVINPPSANSVGEAARQEVGLVVVISGHSQQRRDDEKVNGASRVEVGDVKA